MPLFRLKRKKKKKPELDVEGIQTIIHSELRDYLKRDDVKEILRKIERDDEKRKKWEALSTRMKIKLLKHALAKKGEDGHGSKK